MSTTETQFTRRVWAGDFIRFRGDVYSVIKVNPANYRIKAVDDGKVYNLSRNVTVELLDAAESAEYRTAATIKPVAYMLPGTVVRVPDGSTVPRLSAGPTDPFVVLKHAGGMVKVVKLGGADITWTLSESIVEVVNV
jgi:hypothetical protein